MNIFAVNNYSSYKVAIGDADFLFFAAPSTITDKQSTGATMHSHKFYELFHVLRGNITILTEVGEIKMTEKDTAIVSPGVTHTTIIEAGSLRFSVAFSMTKNKNVTNSNYFEVFQSILDDKIVRLDSFAGAHAFKRFARYFQSDYPEKDELLTACLHEIMVLFKSAQYEENTSSSLLLDTNNLRTYVIDDFFTNKFHHGSLVTLAEQLHLSTQQTQRIIKKMYGQSFSERLTTSKMNYAKTLLSDTNLSVTQIASECGYSGTNGFFVAFKKFFGITPNELRKEYTK